MPSATPSTFLAILIIAVVLLVWWRAALVLLAAFLLAVMAIGVREVVDHIDLQSVRKAEALAPADRMGDTREASHSMDAGGVEAGAGISG